MYCQHGQLFQLTTHPATHTHTFTSYLAPKPLHTIAQHLSTPQTLPSAQVSLVNRCSFLSKSNTFPFFLLFFCVCTLNLTLHRRSQISCHVDLKAFIHVFKTSGLQTMVEFHSTRKKRKEKTHPVNTHNVTGKRTSQLLKLLLYNHPLTYDTRTALLASRKLSSASRADTLVTSS